MSIDLESEVAIAILTGGLSRRMGRAKEQLTISVNGKEETFLYHLCSEFQSFSNKYISENINQNYNVPGYISVQDTYEEIGPIGGIYSVLKETQTKAVLFIACDMPYFSLEAAKYMIQNWSDSDICYSVVDGNRQPLAAIYAKSCIPVIEEQIKSGTYKLGALFEKMNSQSIDMSHYRNNYLNVNTIEDYRGIL